MIYKTYMKRKVSLFCSGVLAVLLLGHSASAGDRPSTPYPLSVVDIPVSLAFGTIRTPEFSPPVSKWFWILIQAEKPLPFNQMACMMGVTAGPLERKDCTLGDPLLQADWALLEGEQTVAQGTTLERCACMFSKQYIFKFIGKFPAVAGKKYVLQVSFTKDGSPLNIAKPHLIITKIGNERSGAV